MAGGWRTPWRGRPRGSGGGPRRCPGAVGRRPVGAATPELPCRFPGRARPHSEVRPRIGVRLAVPAELSRPRPAWRRAGCSPAASRVSSARPRRERRDRTAFSPQLRSPRPPPARPSVRLVPTSITTAPSRPCPRSRARRPHGRDQHIGLAADRGRSRVREWHCVTVALAARSSGAAACHSIEPRARPPALLRAGRRPPPAAPSRPPGAGHHRLLTVLHQQPRVGRVSRPRPCRIDQRDELVLVELIGQRQLQQDPVHPLIGVELASRPASASAELSPGLVMKGLDAHLPSPRASCARRPSRPDPRPPESWPAGLRPVEAISPNTLANALGTACRR